jgi:S1-C subfamily serine protease
LLDSGGRLCGIGSLLVQEKQQGRSAEGNMFVPIDVLEPILGDLLTTGRARRPVRPWLGMYTTEAQGQLLVGGVASGGPAERAGVSAGDLIIEVAHDPVGNLAELWRRIWAIGDAGVEVPLTVAREGTQLSLSVRSADRADFLRKPALH